MGKGKLKSISSRAGAGTDGREIREIEPAKVAEKPRLRNLKSELPNWHTFKQSDTYEDVISVDKIVGSVMRADDYYEDWNPVKIDEKWNELVDAFESGISLDEVSPARPISLIRVRDQYWVGNDGNRRVALAKIRGVKHLKCEVNDILVE